MVTRLQALRPYVLFPRPSASGFARAGDGR